MSVYLADILGNENTKAMMSSYIKNGDLPHAFIIEGPKGSGKKTIAKNIIAALACSEKNAEHIPCGKCINCIKIFKDVSPDVIILSSDGKNSIGVELIRELRNHTYVSSNELEKKAYVIDDSDKMTVQAQNELLKILEEPVTTIVYFLLCENAQQLLPTVISRAPVIRTTRVDANNIYNLSKKSNPTIDDSILKEYAYAAKGIVGRAYDFLDNGESFKYANEIKEKTIEFLMLLSQNKSKYDFISFLTQATEKSTDTFDLLRTIYSSLRDIVAYKEANSVRFDFFYNESELIPFEKTIKPKYAKKICTIIEESINKLYMNQGNASAYTIIYDTAIKIYNSKQ